MLLRSTHRFAAYCALLAMICQLMLPFAHAVAMAQAVEAAWCGTSPQPKVQWANDVQQDASTEQTNKMMFCSVCAMAGAHALVPPTAILVLPLSQIDTVVQFEPDSAEFPQRQGSAKKTRWGTEYLLAPRRTVLFAQGKPRTAAIFYSGRVVVVSSSIHTRCFLLAAGA